MQRPPSSYEVDQIHAIAGWKAEKPGLVGALINRLTHPLIQLTEKVIPQQLVADAIQSVYTDSLVYSHKEKIAARAGVTEIRDLRDGVLRRSDELSREIEVESAEKAMLLGAMSGAGGGVLATGAYVKTLFTSCLKVIHSIGFCYGFGTQEPGERDYALGVLMIASASNPEQKQRALVSLGEIEDLVLEQMVEELVEDAVEEQVVTAAGLGMIPALGMLFGAVQTAEMVDHCADVARFCFQERWLRINGVITEIQPDPKYARSRLRQFGSSIMENVYWTTFGLSFSVCYPFALALSWIPRRNPVVEGLLAGGAQGAADAAFLHDWLEERVGLQAAAPLQTVPDAIVS